MFPKEFLTSRINIWKSLVKNYLRYRVSHNRIVCKHSYLLNREHYPIQSASKCIWISRTRRRQALKAKTWSTREYVEYGSQRGTVSQGRVSTRHGIYTSYLFNLETNNGRVGGHACYICSSAFWWRESSFINYIAFLDKIFHKIHLFQPANISRESTYYTWVWKHSLRLKFMAPYNELAREAIC